ncbi:MAG: hypothetical protein A2X53_06710 [Candidatus Rokubacteria bacterium GWA2_70_23]|nr:MAG: hypothetical protein A2X53_06710 [Candidatus Rokubacteria bacterium GWA2_70_23]
MISRWSGAPTDWSISIEARRSGEKPFALSTATIWDGTITMCVTRLRSISSSARSASKALWTM